MFEGLKKKFSNLIQSIAKKEEEDIGQQEPAKVEAEPAPQHVQERTVPPVKPEEKSEGKATRPAPAHEVAQPSGQGEEKNEKEPPRQAEPPKAKEHHHITRPAAQKHERVPEARAEREKKDGRDAVEESRVHAPAPAPEPAHVPSPEPAKSAEHGSVRQIVEKRPEAQRVAERTTQKQQKAGIGLGTRLKGIIFKEVRVSEKDIDPFMDEFRLSLLQSDVNYDVTERLVEGIRKELLSRQISSSGIERSITEIIRGSILGVLGTHAPVDITENARRSVAAGAAPYKILFIGPNGAGKTTAIAKVAHMLLKNGLTCAISASDTFRAAAIEQTVYHANRLGVPVIKGAYGADPASVAFDAIAYAKAHGQNVVLIDSAGRQETNRSLMEEIKKMVRVSKPDLKIFVGESTVGNALLNQVREFNEAVGLDGIILTKLDCDAKGGNTLSILSDTTVPVLFFGTGESYDALMAYDPDFIVDSILPRAS